MARAETSCALAAPPIVAAQTVAVSCCRKQLAAVACARRNDLSSARSSWFKQRKLIVSAIFTFDPLSGSADDLIRVSALSSPPREARPEPLGDSLQADELLNLLKRNLPEAAC